MQHDDGNPEGSEDKNLTRKDISKLCHNLQSVIDSLPSSDESLPSTMSTGGTKPQTTSSPLRTPPVYASPILAHVDKTVPRPTPPKEKSPVTDCPCQHIFTSDRSSTCALCDRVIPTVEHLLKENKVQEHEIESLKRVQMDFAEKLGECERYVVKLTALRDHLEQQVHSKTEAMEAMQNDVTVLNSKYMKEVERVTELKHAKELVEGELEDLSQRLFEEANKMVAHEKREKHELEVANHQLKKQLEETQAQLMTEELQLTELRCRFEQDGMDHRSSSNTATAPALDPDRTAAHDLADLFCSRLRLSSSAHETPKGIDPAVLLEFTDFIRTCRSLPFKQLHTIPFMKNCLSDDVKPCLHFGLRSRLSSKKLIQAIANSTCFIEETPPGFANESFKRHSPDHPLRISTQKSSMWDSFNANEAPFHGCQACGYEVPDEDLRYRFRTSSVDDWACIDRFCRDRLVSACEFFVFIRNIWQGYYDPRTTASLYYEFMRLRLQMFYARLGVLPWILRTLGVDEYETGKATKPEAVSPDLLESSFPSLSSDSHQSSSLSSTPSSSTTQRLLSDSYATPPLAPETDC